MRKSDSILRNTGFFFIARIIDLVSAIGGFILVGRFLGVAGLGNYKFVISFVAILGGLVNLGMDHIIIREIAKDHCRLPQITGAAFKLKARLLIAIAPFLIGSLIIFQPDFVLTTSILLLFAAHLFLREFFTVIPQAVFLAMERLEYRTISTIAFQLLRFGGIVFAVLTGQGLIVIFLWTVAADVVQAALAMYYMNCKFGPPDMSVPALEYKYLFRESYVFGIAFLFNTAFEHIDNLLLKGIWGEEETGLFSAAYQYISLIVMLVMPLMWVLLPHITRSISEAKEKFVKELGFYLKIVSSLLIPAAIILGFYSEWVLEFTMGEAYRPAGLAMKIVAAALFFRGLGYLFDLTYIAAGKQRFLPIISGIAVFSKLVLDLLLIPHYRHLGAAYGTVGAAAAAFIVSYFILRKHTARLNLAAIIYRPAIAGGLTFLCLLLIPADLPIAGMAAGAAVYLAAVLLLGTFDSTEREMIYSLIKRKLKFIK